MAYCTINDLTQRFGQDELIHLSDRYRTGNLDPLIIEEAIADATDIINAHIAKAPNFNELAAMPALKIKACDIARYYLHTNNVPEVVKERYQLAIEFLKNLVPEGEHSMQAQGGSAIGVSGERKFTMDTMRGF